MHPRIRASVLAAASAVVLAAPAHAQDAAVPIAPAPLVTPSEWEGALGLIVSAASEYQGGSKTAIKGTPAFYLRYKRLTISNSSGFVTRRSDDVLRGLGLDLMARERVHVNLALRFDRGRAESSSDALAGMGDIDPTLRLRLGGTWQLDDGWRLGASWSVDAFGRGGGNFGDVSFARDLRLGRDAMLTWGGALALAGDRYLQTYYGVNEEQAARTGRPLYTPRSGLRDGSLFINVRSPLGPHWSALAGVGVSRLLGPAADSPLTEKVTNWSANVGLAWRF